MPKTYCPECGHPTSYEAKKPSFCCNCGRGFSEKSSQAKKSILKDKYGETEDDEDGDENDQEENAGMVTFDEEILEKMRKKIEIDSSSQQEKRTVGDMVKRGLIEGKAEPLKDKKGKKKINKKVFLQEWKEKNSSRTNATKEKGVKIPKK
jgi:hypothetical protein